jgi:murein DD-endopeptidase MepM/ murein hydrolase activator NlpD
VVLLTATALAGAVIWRAGAQVLPPTPDSTTTAPTPSSTAKPPPTTAKPPPTVPKGPTTTQAPPRPTPTQPPPPPGPTTSTTGPKASQTVPPDALAQINAVRRTAPNSTAGLIQALQALQDFGLTPEEAINVGFGHFPVAGQANWSDDWLMPRFTPTFHLHQGNDIFAPMNTPVRAVADGVVRFSQEPTGGNDVYLTVPDGTYYFCAHLNAYPPGLASGSSVKQGTVIGLVGNTGDAQGGATHCHFEIHPHGGPAVDPKATLDGWVNDAIANIPNVVAAYQANAPKAVTVAGFIRRFDVGDQGMFSAPGRPATGPLLWASSVNPAGGSLRLAQAEVAQVAGEVDWDSLLQREEAKAQAWQQMSVAVSAVLQPTTPKPLAGFFSGPSG